RRGDQIVEAVDQFGAGHANRFFFSSRRRHTRSKRDWSSDVCSSDLVRLWPDQTPLQSLATSWAVNVPARTITMTLRTATWPDNRSEERRVGKECRSRGSP